MEKLVFLGRCKKYWMLTFLFFQNQFYYEELERLNYDVELGEITAKERDKQYLAFEKKSWIRIDTLQKSLYGVLEKIKQIPDYYNKLKSKESENSELFQENWNYFESGRFEHQLTDLTTILEKLVREKESRVRFVTK